jgi:hypothetical protein
MPMSYRHLMECVYLKHSLLCGALIFSQMGLADFNLEESRPARPSPLPSSQSDSRDLGLIDDSAPSVLNSPSHDWAVGFNLGWMSRRDYGARTFRRFNPELVGYRYGSLGVEHYFWRAGLRLGYSSHQPEMPQGMRVEETDTTLLAEGGIMRDWYIVPVVSYGLGYDFRTTKIKIKAPIDAADSRLNRSERLMMWYLQLGAGLPLAKGLFVLEPQLRYQSIEYDDRSRWVVGMEATIGL